MLKGLYILNNAAYQKIYPHSVRIAIEKVVHIYEHPIDAKSIRENLSLLHDADVIFSGWGGPLMDEEFLEAAPNLKAVFYGAGSIKNLVTDAFWERNILITSSYAANAIPVAEYTLSQILFALKKGWYFAQTIKNEQRFPADTAKILEEVQGAYNSTIGIISLGMIARRVCELLRHFDLKVIAYDPFISQKDASTLNVELFPLDELFRQADVVSLHTPWLKETEGMIMGSHFASMKKNATFINTARGAVVNENEMIEVLHQRSDLQAVLDVTYPEPPHPGSLLYTLPNVVLTPHIAGAVTNSECRRMGMYVVEELRRFINGQPALWGITKEKATTMA